MAVDPDVICRGGRVPPLWRSAGVSLNTGFLGRIVVSGLLFETKRGVIGLKVSRKL